MIRHVIVVLMVCFPAISYSQSVCSAINEKIEFEIKQTATSLASMVTERGTPRATLYALEIANSLQLIQINLNLSIQNQCPKRVLPIDPSIYLLEALRCNNDILAGERNSEACDKTKWKGNAINEDNNR